MISIYIGVCKTRDDEKFKESYSNFVGSIVGKYSVITRKVTDTFLPDAQNLLARECLNSGCDYLLLLDDDQWGHTPEMLETLIKADTWVATIKTYSRHYPYCCALAKKIKENVFLPIENGYGYQEVDLSGFPMTLIKRELFEKLEYPYFRAVANGERQWHTDVDFFERLEKIGIKPIGCFQHCLNHDKITQENVHAFRRAEISENNNRGWFNLLKQLQGV